MVKDGIEINRTSPRPYVGMPIDIDDRPDNQPDIDRFPVAMAYVPWQSFEETYEPEIGYKKGTIFPCLFLPFAGGGRK